MNSIKINPKNWETIASKIKRKYNRLTDEDLQFTLGKEEDLIKRLMSKLNQDRTYVVFMINKLEATMGTNLL